ncbi:MAG: hypothetical protein VB858_05380, partial [Planctomycetaceae bacterium]
TTGQQLTRIKCLTVAGRAGPSTRPLFQLQTTVRTGEWRSERFAIIINDNLAPAGHHLNNCLPAVKVAAAT